MKGPSCKHCGGIVNVGDKTCPHCGIPLPPNLGKSSQRKFILWFIAIVVFCFIMIYLLPFFGSSRFPGR